MFAICFVPPNDKGNRPAAPTLAEDQGMNRRVRLTVRLGLEPITELQKGARAAWRLARLDGTKHARPTTERKALCKDAVTRCCGK